MFSALDIREQTLANDTYKRALASQMAKLHTAFSEPLEPFSIQKLIDENPCKGLELQFQLHVANTLAHLLDPKTTDAIAIGLFILSEASKPLFPEPLFDDEFEFISEIPLLPIFSYVTNFPSQTREDATAILNPKIKIMCQITAQFMSTHGASTSDPKAITELTIKFKECLVTTQSPAPVQEKRVHDSDSTQLLEFLERERGNAKAIKAEFLKENVI